MTRNTASLISAIGHPFVLLPLVFSLLAARQVGFEDVWPTLVAIVGSLIVMVAFLFFRKRKGLISDWDVSVQKERGRNIYLPILTVVTVVAAILYFFQQPFVGATLYFGVLMATCYAINAKVKISQHTVIATYLSFLLIPVNAWGGIAFLFFAGLIGWSRVVLGRHQKHEVMMGGAVGVVFGLVQWWLLW